nr:DUF5330 domain-containing protein [uncultured Cohaesibacter sp.]
MSFLIRAAFWLSLVILILPADQETTADSAKLSTTEALIAAQATLKDFTSFCSRQPDVCAAGEVALDNFSAKARYGAKQLYMYLDGEDAAQPSAENELAMNETMANQKEFEQENKAIDALIRSAD